MNATMHIAAAVMAAVFATLPSFAAVDALPEGYTRLEWIASTSDTPYIDTDYTPDQSDKISVRFQQSNDTSSDYQVLFCARDTSNKNTFSCILLKNGTLRFDYNDTTHGWSSALSRLAEYVLDVEGGTQTQSYAVNGNALSNVNSKEGEFSVGSTLRLFATPIGTLPGRFRIYWFKVADSAGTPKVDLRPCRRDSDGVIGMYDLVRNCFCSTGGTGVFDTNDIGLSADYSAREWIESSGTQWINTQFTPLCFDTVSMSFRFRALSDDNLGLFCARNNGNTFTCIKSNSANGNRIRFDRKAGTIGYYGTSPVVNTDYTITMNGSTSQCSVNGSSVSTSGNEGYFAVGSPLVLFAMHQGAANMNNMSSIRLYGFSVTDSMTGAVLCDLLPCCRKSDGTLGLYDRINKRFLANGGAGTFTTREYATILSIR